MLVRHLQVLRQRKCSDRSGPGDPASHHGSAALSGPSQPSSQCVLQKRACRLDGLPPGNTFPDCLLAEISACKARSSEDACTDCIASLQVQNNSCAGRSLLPLSKVLSRICLCSSSALSQVLTVRLEGPALIQQPIDKQLADCPLFSHSKHQQALGQRYLPRVLPADADTKLISATDTIYIAAAPQEQKKRALLSCLQGTQARRRPGLLQLQCPRQ